MHNDNCERQLRNRERSNFSFGTINGIATLFSWQPNFGHWNWAVELVMQWFKWWNEQLHVFSGTLISHCRPSGSLRLL